MIEAGDPRALMRRFAMVGEVAVVDVDAAKGVGSNAGLVRELCRMGRVRVGGGIRDLDTARMWLDQGAERIVIGTSATPEFLGELPRDRVIVALDTKDGEVVTHGWQQVSSRDLLGSIAGMKGLCSGFLVTFVEREGGLGGTDMSRAGEIVDAAGDTRVTIAGGVTTAEEIAALDRLGADAQVGMALYSGRLTLAAGFAAPLTSDRPDGLWATVVVDEHGHALGLAWSNLESLSEAIDSRRGVYRSRTRGRWIKGETSGAVQELLEVSADCDRDTLRFRVRQSGPGFCHLGDRSCWGADRGIPRLARRLAAIAAEPTDGSNTVKLLDDPHLLASKLREEAAELAAAEPSEVAEETADLIYFALVKAISAGIGLGQVEEVLDRRELRVARRPMKKKEVGG